jgi:hypothetical protein
MPQLTQVWTLRAVDVEGKVTLLVHRTEVIEHHAVCTQLLCYDPVNTLVILVALVRIRKVAVWFRTLIRRVVLRRCRGTLRGGRRAPNRLLLAA